MQDGLSATRQTLQVARDRNVPWVCLGDMKHLRDRWMLSALNGLLALFKEYADVPKLLLHGNHDGVAGGRSGLEVFREYALVVEDPFVCKLPPTTSGWKEPFALWPHQPTLDGLPAFLEIARKAKARVLFAHAFLSGAVLGPEEFRLAQKLETFQYRRDVITLEQFGLVGKNRVFDWGFLGDIHKQQHLDPNQSRGRWVIGVPTPGRPGGIRRTPKKDMSWSCPA